MMESAETLNTLHISEDDDLSPMGPRRTPADPVVLAIWSQLRDSPECDRRVVFEAVSRHLREALPSDSEEGKAIESLRSCPQLSRRRYVAWRSEQPDPWDHPTPKDIERLFGSWQAGVDACEGAPVDDPLAGRLVHNGPLLTPEEISAAFLLYVERLDGGLIRQTDFLAFCRQELSSPDCRLVNAPLSISPVERCFGNWRGLIEAHDLLEQSRYAAKRSRKMARVPRAAPEPATPEALLQIIRLAAPEPDERYTGETYEQWCRDNPDELERLGVHRRYSLVHVREHFDSWANALDRAGVLTWEERVRLAACGHTFTDDEALAALQDALESLGSRSSRPAYEKLRRKQLERQAAGGAICELPSAQELFMRLGDGSWPQVVVLALNEMDPGRRHACEQRADELEREARIARAKVPA